MPRPLDPLVAHNFHLKGPSTGASSQATCKHCGQTRAREALRLKDHLKICEAYQNRERHKQETLPLISSTSGDLAQLQKLAADVCFEDNRPLSMWTTPAMRRFLAKLAPAFKPPSDTLVRRKLLPKAYTTLKQEVDEILAHSKEIQLSIDGSTDVRGYGMTSISLVHEKGCFTLETKEVSTHNDGAQQQFKWLKAKALSITQGDLSRLSSIAFDTCATQLKVFHLFEADDDFRHVFIVRCDAHGIALFIQDILKSPECDSARKTAQLLVNQITKKKAMLSLLKEKQEGVYGKVKVLSNMCDTKWATFLDLFESIMRSRSALVDLVQDERCTLDSETREAVANVSFWKTINDMIAILKPINTELVLAQGQTATMEKVLPRWYRLRDNLKALHGKNSLQIMQLVKGNNAWRKSPRSITGWKERFVRQTNKHHVAAFFLDPNTKEKPDNDQLKLIEAAFLSVAPSLLDAASMMRSFMAFLQKTAPFESTEQCWQMFGTDMKFFWARHTLGNEDNLLANYAKRLSTTTASTVTSERSFSALKIVQHRLRNRLSLEHVDQLMFVHFNSKTLRNSTTKKRSVVDIDDCATVDAGIDSEDAALRRDEAMAVVDAWADYFELTDPITASLEGQDIDVDSDSDDDSNDPDEDPMLWNWAQTVWRSARCFASEQWTFGVDKSTTIVDSHSNFDHRSNRRARFSNKANTGRW